jgi:hypothetical protein
MKIFINGKDGKGWAVDMIKQDLIDALKRLNLNRTHNFFTADIIHNIWWNYFLTKTSYPLRLKNNIILSAINFINLEDENYFFKKEFFKANKFAKAWISPSEKQKKILDKYCEHVFTIPYYINFDLFNYKEHIDKREIYKKFNIPENLFENKIVISSFQRDSLASDLTKPKWQKGPELLIELLKDLPKDKFILLLAGPRRHFVINKCKKHNIPYYYIGKEIPEDDININALSFIEMPDLYRITDLYLITSKSEGGPKAAQETTSLKIPVFSTDVGFSGDFINPENIFSDTETYKSVIFDFVNNYSQHKMRVKQVVEEQYSRCINRCNYKTLDSKLLEIYKFVMQ